MTNLYFFNADFLWLLWLRWFFGNFVAWRSSHNGYSAAYWSKQVRPFKSVSS